jgi:hypothetical protein
MEWLSGSSFFNWFLNVVNLAVVSSESGLAVSDAELSHAKITSGSRVIFFSVFINGDKSKIATRKKERNRNPVRMYNCFFDNSSLSLFLKYITAVAATAAIKQTSRYKNQYLEPNEINLCFFQ